VLTAAACVITVYAQQLQMYQEHAEVWHVLPSQLPSRYVTVGNRVSCFHHVLCYLVCSVLQGWTALALQLVSAATLPGDSSAVAGATPARGIATGEARCLARRPVSLSCCVMSYRCRVFVVPFSCCCPVVVVPLSCRYRAKVLCVLVVLLAVIAVSCRCPVVAVPLSCCCRAVVLSLPCRCPVVAVPLSCRCRAVSCHVVVVVMSCRVMSCRVVSCHVVAVSLSYRCCVVLLSCR
jgi:hypothetical protein